MKINIFFIILILPFVHLSGNGPEAETAPKLENTHTLNFTTQEQKATFIELLKLFASSQTDVTFEFNTERIPEQK